MIKRERHLILSAEPGAAVWLMYGMIGSVAHGAEEFVVVGGALHAFLDEFHSFDGVAVGEESAEDPHAREGFFAEEEVVTAGA